MTKHNNQKEQSGVITIIEEFGEPEYQYHMPSVSSIEEAREVARNVLRSKVSSIRGWQEKLCYEHGVWSVLYYKPKAN